MWQSWCVQGDYVVSGETAKKSQSVGVMCCIMFISLSHFYFLLSLFLFPSFALAPPPPPPPRPVENDNTLRIKNEKTRSLLLFTNVTEKHFGNYTCFASNRLGASNASMLLFRKWTHTTACGLVHAATRVHMYMPPVSTDVCSHWSHVTVTVRKSSKEVTRDHKTIHVRRHFFLSLRSLVSFWLFALHSIFSAFYSPPPSTFSFFSAPLKLCLPILPSLPLSLSLSYCFPSCFHPPSLVRTHSCVRTRTVILLCPVTQDVVISLQAQFTLNVPNERFPTPPFPVTLPPPPLVHSALPS